MQTSVPAVPAMPIAQSDQASSQSIDHPVITQYFESLNAGAFEATGQLFAADGALQPPFEEPIVGPAAIAAYLEAEAQGFILQPQQATTELREDGCTELQVVGRVQTPMFSVNVAWLFILNPDQEILLIKIKLLASLQELVKFRS